MTTLVKKLNLTQGEFNEYTMDTTTRMRRALRRVIFDNMSYEKAGKSLGVSRQAIYHHLKKMHDHKYPEDE